MNAIGDHYGRVDPKEWDQPEMRAALAERDITLVYRLLQKLGYSQQRIAAMTGQSQPEVSAIIHGRKVMAYDVLSRICDGLGAPRGYMGLGYDEPPAKPIELSVDRPHIAHDQSAEAPDEPAGEEPDNWEVGDPTGQRLRQEPVSRRTPCECGGAWACACVVPVAELRWFVAQLADLHAPDPRRLHTTDVRRCRAGEPLVTCPTYRKLSRLAGLRFDRRQLPP